MGLEMMMVIDSYYYLMMTLALFVFVGYCTFYYPYYHYYFLYDMHSSSSSSSAHMRTPHLNCSVNIDFHKIISHYLIIVTTIHYSISVFANDKLVMILRCPFVCLFIYLIVRLMIDEFEFNLLIIIIRAII